MRRQIIMLDVRRLWCSCYRRFRALAATTTEHIRCMQPLSSILLQELWAFSLLFLFIGFSDTSPKKHLNIWILIRPTAACCVGDGVIVVAVAKYKTTIDGWDKNGCSDDTIALTVTMAEQNDEGKWWCRNTVQCLSRGAHTDILENIPITCT